MLKLPQFGTVLLRFRKRDWLCLLLAVTFLYNPFLVASSSSFGLSVRHLPSFRATVAYSEFLKFKPKEKSDTVAVPACELQELSNLPPAYPSTSTHRGDAEELIPSWYFPVGNLWFRPPPVA